MCGARGDARSGESGSRHADARHGRIRGSKGATEPTNGRNREAPGSSSQRRPSGTVLGLSIAPEVGATPIFPRFDYMSMPQPNADAVGAHGAGAHGPRQSMWTGPVLVARGKEAVARRRRDKQVAHSKYFFWEYSVTCDPSAFLVPGLSTQCVAAPAEQVSARTARAPMALTSARP